VNAADLDFTGSIMPPPGTASALTEDEKRTIARWVDLGCPLDTGALDGHTDARLVRRRPAPVPHGLSPRAGAIAAPVGDPRRRRRRQHRDRARLALDPRRSRGERSRGGEAADSA
jgi:hypothetical protein